MRLEDGRVALLDRHLARLERSAAAFGTPFDSETTRTFLGHLLPALGSRKHPVRVRMTLGPAGHLRIQEGHADFRLYRKAWIDPRPFVHGAEVGCRHKTTTRTVYDGPMDRAQGVGADDAILVDADGWVIESTTANVFALFDDLLVTPPLTAAGLPGVMREHVLATRPGAVEARIHVDELRRADAVYLTNAVRGWMPVEVI
jgi:para-aminobenzoate synthetase/4-amino-4-deoxychorismate lyase